MAHSSEIIAGAPFPRSLSNKSGPVSERPRKASGAESQHGGKLLAVSSVALPRNDLPRVTISSRDRLSTRAWRGGARPVRLARHAPTVASPSTAANGPLLALITRMVGWHVHASVYIARRSGGLSSNHCDLGLDRARGSMCRTVVERHDARRSRASRRFDQIPGPCPCSRRVRVGGVNRAVRMGRPGITPGRLLVLSPWPRHQRPSLRLELRTWGTTRHAAGLAQLGCRRPCQLGPSCWCSSGWA